MFEGISGVIPDEMQHLYGQMLLRAKFNNIEKSEDFKYSFI